jgi:hypothetical protein
MIALFDVVLNPFTSPQCGTVARTKPTTKPQGNAGIG